MHESDPTSDPLFPLKYNLERFNESSSSSIKDLGKCKEYEFQKKYITLKTWILIKRNTSERSKK